jgi:hypothetical protein
LVLPLLKESSKIKKLTSQPKSQSKFLVTMSEIKVHLIRTAEYNADSLNEVAKLLQKILNNPSENIAIESSEVTFGSADIGLLSWERMFNYCEQFRTNDGIPNSDFVVLLTSMPNEKNWFSHFDQQRNIFVHTDGWDRYTASNPIYPITHQIIENMVQYLMDVGPINESNPFIHYEMRGCLNDMCGNKETIMFKFRTADLCHNCLTRANEKLGVPLTNIIINALESLRGGLLNRSTVTNRPVKLVLNEKDSFELPDLKIQLTLPPLNKCLYYYFLKKDDGVLRSELSNDQVDLLNYYTRFNPGKDPQVSSRTVEKLVDLLDNSFNEKVSAINKCITYTIVPNISSFYKIDGGRNDKYLIRLPKDLIEIP